MAERRANYELITSDSRVEAWSTKRLPFEPQGWLIDYRDGLRRAVRALASSGHLHARYSSEVIEPCDAENILFYNLGTSWFEELAKRGIVFERSFDPSLEGRSAFKHHVCYATNPSERPFWEAEQVLADWETAISQEAVRDVAAIWLATKTRTAWHLYVPKVLPQYFGLTLTLSVPSSISLNLVSVVKPLFDGVIAGLHSYRGDRLEDVAGRIGQKLGSPAATVRTVLLDTSKAVLGPRQVVWPRMESVQWNPADDCCFLGKLVRKDSRTNDWSIRASLSTLRRTSTGVVT